MILTVTFGDYTHVYSSREHAMDVGIVIHGKDNAFNPVGYIYLQDTMVNHQHYFYWTASCSSVWAIYKKI
jgi:hypothetical protein